MDNPNALTYTTSSDESCSPRRFVSFEVSTTSPQNIKASRTKSLSPTPKSSYKNRVFPRSADSSPHIPKPRSKTEPELISAYLQKPIESTTKNLLSKSPSPPREREEDRATREKEKRNKSPRKILSGISPSPSRNNDCSPFIIFRSKMDIFNDICFFLKDHNKNPNIQDLKTNQTEFHC